MPGRGLRIDLRSPSHDRRQHASKCHGRGSILSIPRLETTILIDRKAVRLLTQPFTITTTIYISFLTSLSSTVLYSDMSQPSSFQDLFDAALQEYQNQTGCKLIEHPLAKQLETCNSVDSITAILQEQAQVLREFRPDDGRLMKSLKSSVGVLYTLSTTGILSGSIGLVHPKTFIWLACS
jgi:hypothetical protein